jgi:phosphatidylserine/phosphatidylglycerophosphate/cardiolipin synthase-like enzyme
MTRWVSMLVLLLACGGSDRRFTDASADGGEADAGPDGDATIVTEPCSELDPRSSAPEAFVGPEGLSGRLVSLLDGAEESLRVATYELDAPEVVSALTRAQARGVDVRVLIDEERTANTASAAELRGAGIDVRDGPDAFTHYHPKVIVVDETRAVVMSANLNTYSMATERNHGVLLDDSFDVADLIEVFDHDYEGRAGDPVAASCTRLVLSPHNSRARILRLIASAETELRVQHLSMTDEEVRFAIGSRAMAGVSTRVILADPFWIESNTAAAEALRAIGVEVRFLSTPENHAKLIVADGTAFVGSENLSWTSLEANREVGLMVTNDTTVAPLSAVFDADWAAASP